MKGLVSMDKPIKCLECYKKRPGGRCNFCPVKNKDQYQELGGGFYIKKQTDEKLKQKLDK
jgi:hypothetical protein